MGRNGAHRLLQSNNDVDHKQKQEDIIATVGVTEQDIRTRLSLWGRLIGGGNPTFDLLDINQAFTANSIVFRTLPV